MIGPDHVHIRDLEDRLIIKIDHEANLVKVLGAGITKNLTQKKQNVQNVADSNQEIIQIIVTHQSNKFNYSGIRDLIFYL